MDPYILAAFRTRQRRSGDVFYPTFILRLLLPVDVAITWSFLLHSFSPSLYVRLVRTSASHFGGAVRGGLVHDERAGRLSGLTGHDGKML